MDMHADLNVATLYQRRCQHIAIQVYKFLHNIGPTSCQSLLRFVENIHNMATRSSDNLALFVPITRLTVTDHDFTVIGPKIWNEIPINIRRIDTLENFKHEIKNFVFS